MCALNCHDGLVFTQNSTGITRVYRCSCQLGDKHATPQYAPSDKAKERPIVLPVWQPKKLLDGRDKASGNDD